MAYRFGWRADDANLYARYSTNGKYGTAMPVFAPPTRAVDATAISGYSINVSAGIKSLVFRGANFVDTSAVSFTLRCSPNYSGAPAANRGLFGAACAYGNSASMAPVITLVHAITTGNILVTIRNNNGASVAASVSLGAWSPTAGTWYDLTFTWDYSTTANAMKFYVDNALLGSATAGAAMGTVAAEAWKEIWLGGVISTTSCDMKFEECAIWDTVIDPTANIALESGNGLLNGASRTSLISNVAGSVLENLDGLAASGGGSTHSSSYNWSN